jgi:hypothetical protein
VESETEELIISPPQFEPGAENGLSVDTKPHYSNCLSEADILLEEDKEMDAIVFGERHWCDTATLCICTMTDGHLCGLHVNECNRHAEKRANGGQGTAGWYLYDPKTSPRHQARGRFHIVATSLETKEARSDAKQKTYLEMEAVMKNMETFTLDDAKPKLEA